MKIQTQCLLGTLVASVALVGSANAAVITWGPATDVGLLPGNSSDVSTIGTLVEAYNAINGAVDPNNPALNDVTVNGVLFVATRNLLTGSGESTATPLPDASPLTNSGDPEYDALLSRPDFGGGKNLVTLTLGEGDGNGVDNGGGNLIVGLPYLIQIWYVDEANAGTRTTPVGDGNGNKVVLDASGQFAIGTFTADGITQQITLESPGFGNAHITAYQIRLVPEPSSLALLGLGGLLIARRRRSA